MALKDASASVQRPETVRLLSIKGADVGALAVGDVDLRACRFIGAGNLDQLRIEGSARFPLSPPGRRWTRRRTIADEHYWRANERSEAAWCPARCRPSSPTARDDGAVEFTDSYLERDVTPAQLASTYRALRKGQEDRKNEPGAADFYYGEMEARRHDGHAARAERYILWLYWAVSGYGLRGSRALLALIVTVIASAVIFDLGGFNPDRGFGHSLLFSAESTSSLFRAPDPEKYVVTDLGEALQLPLRLIGPLLFGLALLSLRGRVKR